MPTTTEDSNLSCFELAAAANAQRKTKTNKPSFEALDSALKADSIEDVKSIISTVGVTEKDDRGETCLIICCRNSSSTPEVIKFVFAKIVEAGGPELLKIQLNLKDKSDVPGRSCLENICIHPSPDVKKLLAVALFYVDLFSKQHLELQRSFLPFDYDQTVLKRDKLNDKQKSLERDTRISSPYWTPWSDDKTTPEYLKLVYDIHRIVGSDEYLENLFEEQKSDSEYCIEAVCRSTPNYDTLALLVSNMFDLGRYFLRQQLLSGIFGVLSSKCIFRRSFDSEDDKKVLWLMVDLHSITGLFAEYYSRFDNHQREILKKICNIESGEWSRATSNDSAMGDMIGEIKKSIQDKKRH